MKWLPGKGRSRSIDLILGLDFPVGRAKAEPNVFSPFQHPPASQPPAARSESPEEEVRRTVAMVKDWALQLRTKKVSGLSCIAKSMGVSVPRVSQLMVLSRLTDPELDHALEQLKRVSVRAVMGWARKSRSISWVRKETSG